MLGSSIKRWRGSVTRQKMRKWKFKKKKIGLGLERCFFLSFFSRFYCACIESWSIRHFCAQHVILYFLCYVYIHHTARHQENYLMPNSFPRVRKYGRSTGSSDQCCRTHPRGVWTWDSRDQEKTYQVSKTGRRSRWSKGRAPSRVFTLSNSAMPLFLPASKSSTRHPDREQLGLSL